MHRTYVCTCVLDLLLSCQYSSPPHHPFLQDAVSRKTNNPAARAGVLIYTMMVLKKEIEREKLKPVSQHSPTPDTGQNCLQ